MKFFSISILYILKKKSIGVVGVLVFSRRRRLETRSLDFESVLLRGVLSIHAERGD